MKKVRQIITVSKWIDGSGYTNAEIYDDKTFEISELEIAKPMDWSWWDTQELSEGEDLQITVKLYPADYDPCFDADEPIATWSIMQSEL